MHFLYLPPFFTIMSVANDFMCSCFYCVRIFPNADFVFIHIVLHHHYYKVHVRNGTISIMPDPRGYIRCQCTSSDCEELYWTQAGFEQHLVVASLTDWQSKGVRLLQLSIYPTSWLNLLGWGKCLMARRVGILILTFGKWTVLLSSDSDLVDSQLNQTLTVCS